jgi:hypothetical protein
MYKNTTAPKGGLTQGFIRSKSDIFPQYRVKKPWQASALPWFFNAVLPKNLSFWSAAQF